MYQDTIYAPATARGKAGVAVIRISGPKAREAAESLSGSLGPARQMVLRSLRTASGERLDEALVVWFAEGGSFTGEEVVELHVHGGLASVRAILDSLGAIPDLRLAKPGEFTQRAFLNGRLDMSQVESLGDLIDAETEAQRRQALRSLSGELGRRVADWRNTLVQSMAMIAATLDFADEEVPDAVDAATLASLSAMADELQAALMASQGAERLRGGFTVAIVGAPNAGKSTLLNRIAGRDAAIVSEEAGTTRDVLEVAADLGGLPVTFLDTAGLREGAGEVESEGIRRALRRAEAADLRIFLTESGETPDLAADLRKDGDIIARNKADLGDGDISALTGQGVDGLLRMIQDRLEGLVPDDPVVTTERQQGLLREARDEIRQAIAELSSSDPRSEVASFSLERAARALEMLIGRVDVEDLLDEVFARFCLGK